LKSLQGVQRFIVEKYIPKFDGIDDIFNEK